MHSPTAPDQVNPSASIEPGTVPCDVTIVAHDVGSVGGMERQLAELTCGLARLGHRVTVVARTCDLPLDVEVSFHRVHAPRRPFLLGYLWFMIEGSIVVRRKRRGHVQAAGAIIFNRVDTIAVHCCHQVYTTLPASRRRGARLYASLVRQVKRRVERWCYTANSRARFVCVSNGVAEEIRAHYPQTSERVVVIHNGVDAESFRGGRRADEALALRSSLGIAGDRQVAAFVGGLWEHKGLRPVIEALARAPGWDLLVAGAGTPRAYDELASSLGVGAVVHWLGVVEDIQLVYEAADAFVLPSSYETFSLVTFEAAASGLPLIATPVSGVNELLVDGETGLTITREASSIARALRRLSAEPALRVRLGEAARAAALEFGWEKMIDRHSALFNAMREPPRAGAPELPADPR